MDIWQVLLIIATLGGIGGVINCAITGEFKLPEIDKDSKIWRPGWIGNVLIGSVAAVAVWGVYGPIASYEIAMSQPIDIHLTVSQLITSIIIGLGGGKILTQMAEIQSKQITLETLSSSLKNSVSKKLSHN